MIARRVLAALAGTVLIPALAAAQSAAPIQAQEAWSRATPPHAATGVVYVTLTSRDGDRLVGVSSPMAAAASIHVTQMDGAIMRMRAVEGGLDLPAGQAVALAPGGYHVMLEGLKAPLVPGHSVPVHLTFQKAPPLDLEVQVRPTGRPATTPMPGMPMAK